MTNRFVILFFAVLAKSENIGKTIVINETYSTIELYNQTISKCETEINELSACLTVVAKELDIGSQNAHSLINKTYMLSMIDGFKNATCFSSPACTEVKVLKYFHDAVFYIGNKVYREGFECMTLEFSSITTNAQKCYEKMVSNEEKSQFSLSFLMRGVADCAFSHLVCPPDEITALMSAAKKVVKLMEFFDKPDMLYEKIQTSISQISKEQLIQVVNNLAYLTF